MRGYDRQLLAFLRSASGKGGTRDRSRPVERSAALRQGLAVETDNGFVELTPSGRERIETPAGLDLYGWMRRQYGATVTLCYPAEHKAHGAAVLDVAGFSVAVAVGHDPSRPAANNALLAALSVTSPTNPPPLSRPPYHWSIAVRDAGVAASGLAHDLADVGKQIADAVQLRASVLILLAGKLGAELPDLLRDTDQMEAQLVTMARSHLKVVE